MSGFGERFRRAGYAVPKPLIKVEGKPVIAHVLDLFPGEENVVFICNEEQLANPSYQLAATLNEFCPTGRIVAIKGHKLGPVYAVAQAFEALDPEQPTIVNYCDFACLWDYEDFKGFTASTGCDGAVVSYKGFHPHMLGSCNYAYVQEQDGWVSAIQEKQPFTDTPMNEFASSGTYYFRNGKILKQYFERTLARADLKVNGEYYVSLAYRPMLEDGCRVTVYELQRFMQFGTPHDLAEYQYWSRIFRRLSAGNHATACQPGTVMVPMAGLGTRFAKEGYETPKPLIPVSGQPMVVQAVTDLPEAEARAFVLLQDMPGRVDIEATLRERFPGCVITALESPTDGQARTCLLGLDGVETGAPLTIGACDNGTLYDGEVFAGLLANPEVDVIVWVARGHPGAVRHPEMYGWVDANSNGVIRRVSVKVPLSDPATDLIVIGVFTFRHTGDFVAATERMIAEDRRVNDEFYIDECINDAIALGLRCRIFEVDGYVCWGTPDDLRTFEYWQSCFHHLASHPYRADRDPRYHGVPPIMERVPLRIGGVGA